MEHGDLEHKIAYYEFINDQLSAELKYIDQLLKEMGFEQGLITLKIAAEEIIRGEERDPPL